MASAVFFGPGLALLTSRADAPLAKQKLKRRKAVWVPFLLNLALALALWGLFFTRTFAWNQELALTFGGLVLALFLAWRFPRTLGTLTVLVLVVGTAAILGLLEGSRPLPGERTLIQTRLLATGDATWKVESYPEPAEIWELAKDEWFPINVRILKTPGLFSLAGAPLWYRLDPRPADQGKPDYFTAVVRFFASGVGALEAVLRTTGHLKDLRPGLPPDTTPYKPWDLILSPDAKLRWQTTLVTDPF